MSRFEDASSDVVELMNKIIEDDFRDLIGARIKIVFDLKKRNSGGKMTLGRMKKATEFERYLSSEETDTEEGYDYIMFLDKMVFTNIEESDKVRIIRHELQHTFVDGDANKPYKIIGHDTEDFYEEMEKNADDPRWGERIALIAAHLYEQDDE